ncbi:hypothetical protein L0F63_005964, partial [Massospora cicadina]
METTKDVHNKSEYLSFTQEILPTLDSTFSQSAHLSGERVVELVFHVSHVTIK